MQDYAVNSAWNDASGIYLNNPLVAARMALPYDAPYYYSFDDNGNMIKGDRAAKLLYSGITMPWWVSLRVMFHVSVLH